VQSHASEHRNCRPGRQRTGRPGDRIGEDIAFDEDLHGKPPFLLAPRRHERVLDAYWRRSPAAIGQTLDALNAER
jgi:hypothetical protein